MVDSVATNGASDAWVKFVEHSGAKLLCFPSALAAAIKNIQEQQEKLGMRIQDKLHLSVGSSHAATTSSSSSSSNAKSRMDESGALCIELIHGG